MLIRSKNKKAVIRLSVISLGIIVGLAAFLILRGAESRSPSSPAEKVAKTSQVLLQETKPASDKETKYGIPARLVMPSIGVDTNILEVGLTESGDMESPNTNEDTGWYKYGARPGNTGSAVIAGHLGLSGDAVFGRLSQLKKGDTLSVIDDKDQTASFVVTHSREYGNDEAPSEVFLSESGSHLNLITCEGDWNDGQNTYSRRLVVFTDRVD